MEILTQLMAGTLIFIGGLFGAGVLDVDTVEIGLSEMSPLGAEGGYAIPASGCAGGDCEDVTLTVDKSLIRAGDDVEVCWYPKGHSVCSLSPAIKFTDSNPTADGCEFITQIKEAVYELTCTDPASLGPKTSSKRVRVLPAIYES